MTQPFEPTPLPTIADLLDKEFPPANLAPWVRVDDGIAFIVGGYPYTVTRAEVNDSARGTHVLRHILHKGWATDDVIAGLIRFIDEVLSKVEGDNGEYR